MEVTYLIDKTGKCRNTLPGMRSETCLLRHCRRENSVESNDALQMQSVAEPVFF